MTPSKTTLTTSSSQDAHNPLSDLRNAFRRGELTKAEYIERMHAHHMLLWDYQALIHDENIASIEITPDCVFITAKTGVKIICDRDDKRLAPMDILNFGDYEASELAVMRRYVSKNSVIVDIGANVGWYSLHLSKDAPEGRIYAFEPIPKTYEYLKRNIALNGVKNVETFMFGFSDKEETVEFFFYPDLSVATSMRDIQDGREQVKIRCQIKRMDDVLPAITDRIDLIKCDVEGAELFVLRGGLKTIERTRPVLFIEMLRKWSAKFGYHPNDIIKLLVGLGYACYAIDDAALIPIESVTEETAQTNFLFLHPGKHKIQ